MDSIKVQNASGKAHPFVHRDILLQQPNDPNQLKRKGLHGQRGSKDLFGKMGKSSGAKETFPNLSGGKSKGAGRQD